MSEKKRILALSGSLKATSTNASIIKYIASSTADIFEVVSYDQLDALPHFSPDRDASPPPSVQALRAAIDAADGVLICTPEYVFSLPSVLKNAIEWTVSTTVLSDKPVALITAAASGEKAMASLQLILSTLYARVHEDTSLILRGAKGMLDEHGHVSAPQAQQDISRLIQAFQERLDLAQTADGAAHR